MLALDHPASRHGAAGIRGDMMNQEKRFRLTKEFRSRVARSKEELRKIPKMTIEQFEDDYRGMTPEGARENLQGQIVGYMAAIKSINSLG